jgi:hypothetical protein
LNLPLGSSREDVDFYTIPAGITQSLTGIAIARFCSIHEHYTLMAHDNQTIYVKIPLSGRGPHPAAKAKTTTS